MIRGAREIKLMAFNGSPGKNGTTAALLEEIANGARAGGVDAKVYHLYDLNQIIILLL